jgi:acetyl esterase
VSIRSAVEARTLNALLALPEGVQRRLGGRPDVQDGEPLAADLQLMLRLQRLARKRGLVSQPPLEVSRRDMLENARVVGGRQPIGAVRDLEVAGLPARHYLPSDPVDPSGAGPLLLFFHGGGFLNGDLESHDAPCRVLAEESGVPVLAVEYRCGPETAFPGAFDDAEAAHRWVVDNADSLGADPARLGVAGDSAGGNIAAWTAIAAARAGTPLAWQLLLYPCTDPRRTTKSLQLFEEGYYLTRDFMDHVNDVYLPTATERDDERVQLLATELPQGLAAAYVVTAGFDPLRDEGETYAQRLADAGVAVEVQRFPDQIHGFLNIVGVGSSSRAAVLEIAQHVRKALG